MTTPDATATANTDAPVATVPWGLSEIGAYIGAAAMLVNSIFGRDYGLSKNAAAISLLLSGLLILGNNLSRAVKHHAAIHANAAVYLAQLKQVGDVVMSGGGASSPTVAQLAAGVSVLNKAVAADTATVDKPQTRS